MSPVLLPGFATPEGTTAYGRRVAAQAVPEHFRLLDRCWLSSVGIGTYLGGDDADTDGLYREAVARALELGVNVIDTAINYRHQRSERAIGEALAALIRGGRLGREEVVVATKGGFIPFDGAMPANPRAHLLDTYLRPGIVKPNEVVAGCHSMAPRYLADQLERSRHNLGLDTVDIYYLHNPETQLGELDRTEFRRRIRDAFAWLEAAVADGKIRQYGTATWNGYRQPPDAQDYLSLAELVAVAGEVGGGRHHFRVIQLPLNLAMTEALTRRSQTVDGDTVSTLEACRRLGIYAVASAAVSQGRLTRGLPAALGQYLAGLTSDAQRALQFTRSAPGIGTALVGMKRVAHVEENLAVAKTPPLPWSEFERLFRAG